VTVALTWLVGLGKLAHIIAGSVETGPASLQHVAVTYMLPTLTGNIIGGVSLVAALNHAQMVSK